MTSGGGMALAVSIALGLLFFLRCICGRAGMTMRDGWAMSFCRRVKRARTYGD